MPPDQKVTQPPFLLQDYHQATHKLYRIRSVVEKAGAKINAIQQRNQLRQQRAQICQTRINQLVAQAQQLKSGSTSQSSQQVNLKSVTGLNQRRTVEQLNQQLRQRSSLLRQSAHDLKSNFSLISGATYLLSRVRTDKERKEMLAMLERNVHQASQLISELLDVTRLEAGEDRRQLTYFDAANLLSELVQHMQPLTHKKELDLCKRGISSLPIEGDWVKLYRIAQNLLLDAINHSTVGEVTLSWGRRVAHQQWYLRITGTGPSLLTASHRASEEGIGLLIVRQLCTLLEGTLKVKEPKRGGTQVTVTFPIRYS